jgi:CheY-like chemotaxis protein
LLVLDATTARIVQPEFDRLLDHLQHAVDSSASAEVQQQLRALPLRIVVLASRWRLTVAQQDGSAPSNNDTVHMSVLQTQLWPNVRVRLQLAPVPQRELLLALLAGDDEDDPALQSAATTTEETDGATAEQRGTVGPPHRSLRPPTHARIPLRLGHDAVSSAPTHSHPSGGAAGGTCTGPPSAPYHRSPSELRSPLSADSVASMYTPRSAVRSIRPIPAVTSSSRFSPTVAAPQGQVWPPAANGRPSSTAALPSPHAAGSGTIVGGSCPAVAHPCLSPSTTELVPVVTASAFPHTVAASATPGSVSAPAPLVPSSGSSAPTPILPPRRRRVAEAIAPLQPRLPFSLMLVEDNRVNIRMMSMLLAKLGWNLTNNPATPSQLRSVCTDGQMCLDEIERAISGAEAEQAHGAADRPAGGAGAAALASPAHPSSSSSPSASSCSSSSSLPPQVILMDVSMEPLDGLECASSIRDHHAARYRALGLRPPFIIACTANVTNENKRQCAQAGMHHFLGKPVSLELLVAALELAGRYVFARSDEEATAAIAFVDL